MKRKNNSKYKSSAKDLREALTDYLNSEHGAMPCEENRRQEENMTFFFIIFVMMIG